MSCSEGGISADFKADLMGADVVRSDVGLPKNTRIHIHIHKDE